MVPDPRPEYAAERNLLGFIPADILRHTRLSPTDKLVFVGLRALAGPDVDDLRTSASLLGRLVGLPLKQTQNSLGNLQKIGHVLVEHEPGPLINVRIEEPSGLGVDAALLDVPVSLLASTQLSVLDKLVFIIVRSTLDLDVDWRPCGIATIEFSAIARWLRLRKSDVARSVQSLEAVGLLVRIARFRDMADVLLLTRRQVPMPCSEKDEAATEEPGTA